MDKTTTAVNQGVSLANQGKEVLLMGADAQANLTMAMGWGQQTSNEQKKELFAKVRSGEVCVLLGSTPKMGAGTNVQDRWFISVAIMMALGI